MVIDVFTKYQKQNFNKKNYLYIITMQKWVEILNAIENETSAIKKKDLLEVGIISYPDLEKLLRLTFDTNLILNVDSKSIENALGIETKLIFKDIGEKVEWFLNNQSYNKSLFDIENNKTKSFEDFVELIKDLKENRGMLMKTYLNKFFLNCDKNDAKWYSRCIVKNLSSTISVLSVNKVLRKCDKPLITKFSLQLAVALGNENIKEKIQKLLDENNNELYCETKHDGCLYWNSKIQTDKGLYNIGDIVDNKLQLNVLSYNENNNIFEYKPIINWYNNGKISNKEWVQIEIGNKKNLKVTKNHKIFTNNGWKEAQYLNPNIDKLLINDITNIEKGIIFGMLLGDGSIKFEKGYKTCRLSIFSSIKENLEFKKKLLSNSITNCKSHFSGYSDTEIFRTSFLLNKKLHNMIDFINKKRNVSLSILEKYFTNESLSIWFSDDGNIAYNNGNKNTPVIQISTHRYSYEEVRILKSFLENKYNIKISIIKDKRVKTTNGEYLKIYTEGTLKLMNILKNYMIKGTEYKYFFKNKYIDYQQFIPKYSTFTIQPLKRTETITKYDIEVKDNHNYIADNILVHNCRLWLGNTNPLNLGKWEALSRNGKPVLNVNNLLFEAERIFGNTPTELDGELIADNFYSLSKTIHSKNDTGTIMPRTFKIFDILKYKEDLTNLPYKTRRNILLSTIPKDSLIFNIINSNTLTDINDIIDFYNEQVELGEEGIIIKTNSPYTYKREHWHKLKPSENLDLKIIGFEIAYDGKYSGMRSSIIVSDLNGKLISKVGSGLKDSDIELFTMGEEKDWIGKIVEVQFDSITPINKDGIKSLRFPRFVKLREDKDIADSIENG